MYAMRKKENYIIITFVSTTSAMAAEEYLRTRSVPGRMIPLPGSIAAGCGLAWRIALREYDDTARHMIQKLEGVEEIHTLAM